jgi:cytochrome c-type biogenesis protein CcmH
LAFVVVGVLVVGATRDSGPRTPDERIESISKRLACPVCQGESVYESRNTASNQIREAIRQGVAEGQLSDEQIIQQVALAYEGEELLATAFVLGAAGLAIAFRRWQRTARLLGEATQEDYELVARALADEPPVEPGEEARRDPPDRS